MSAKSRFDPLDMALGALAPPADASPPTSSALVAPPAAPNPRKTAGQRPVTIGRKVQLNVYVDEDIATELRTAVIELGQRHSLGDVVAALVSRHLPSVVEDLAGGDEARSDSRLRSGRKVRS